MAAMAMNATDYYFAGAANGWSNNNDAWKFVEVEGVLTLEVEDLYGDFKITENGAWHPQHGGAAAGEGVLLGGSYNLVKCDDSQGEADAPANCTILIPEGQGEGEWRYKNAKLTLDASNPDALVISLVEGTLYDHSAAPKTYQIVGAFNGWDAAGAPSFEEVEGVLTVNIADLSGTFKIIEDHAWTNQWATNWETGGGLALGVPYVLGAKGDAEPDNLKLANPFGGYKNAVHQILLAEFGQDFKIVYGQWSVEFGAAKGSQDKWTVNTELQLANPCDNFYPAEDIIYEDVTITLVVDYENVAATLTIATETQGVENIQLNAKSIKRIENGQVLVEREGVRYNMNGAKQ